MSKFFFLLQPETVTHSLLCTLLFVKTHEKIQYNFLHVDRRKFKGNFLKQYIKLRFGTREFRGDFFAFYSRFCKAHITQNLDLQEKSDENFSF